MSKLEMSAENKKETFTAIVPENWLELLNRAPVNLSGYTLDMRNRDKMIGKELEFQSFTHYDGFNCTVFMDGHYFPWHTSALQIITGVHCNTEDD